MWGKKWKLKYLDGISVRRIKSSKDPSLELAIRLYEELFPESERDPTEEVKAIFNGEENDRFVFLVAEKKSLKERIFKKSRQPEVVGFKLSAYIPSSNVEFECYIATHKNYRRRGIATFLDEEMNKRMEILSKKAGYNGVYAKVCELELEDHSSLEREKETIGRLIYYEKRGTRPLVLPKDAPYLQPPVRNDQKPLPFYLAIKPSEKNCQSISIEKYKEIVKSIHSDVDIYPYNKDPETLYEKMFKPLEKMRIKEIKIREPIYTN